MMSKYSFSTTLQTFIDQNSGACDEDAPDSVEAVLSGCETKQEGQVHQGIFIQMQMQIQIKII